MPQVLRYSAYMLIKGECNNQQPSKSVLQSSDHLFVQRAAPEIVLYTVRRVLWVVDHVLPEAGQRTPKTNFFVMHQSVSTKMDACGQLSERTRDSSSHMLFARSLPARMASCSLQVCGGKGSGRHLNLADRTLGDGCTRRKLPDAYYKSKESTSSSSPSGAVFFWNAVPSLTSVRGKNA